ncbi:hypothetical protein [Arthrobacter sp. C152]
MHWDLGFWGLALLALMSLVFGLLFHFIVGFKVMRWVWVMAAAAYFLAGVLVSEVWFGWATAEDLQPNIDGLSFDEVNLVTLAGLIVAVFLRQSTKKRRAAAASAARRARPSAGGG